MQAPIPSRESCHAQQLLSLLQITQALQPYLLLDAPEVGVSPPVLNEQAEAAAVAAFVGACGRISELLADKSRWSLAPQDELYAALVKTQEEQQGFLRAQAAAANGLRRPSYQLRPSLFEIDGGYLAVYGDLKSPVTCLVGRGKTPAAALEDFDKAFHRTSDDQFKIIAESTTAAVEKRASRKGKRGQA